MVRMVGHWRPLIGGGFFFHFNFIPNIGSRGVDGFTARDMKVGVEPVLCGLLLKFSRLLCVF